MSPRRLTVLTVVLFFAAGSFARGAEVSVQSAAGRVTVTRGDLTLVFDADGNGFISSAARGGNVVCSANAAGGVFAALAMPEGQAAPFAPLAAAPIRGKPAVTSIAARKVGDDVHIDIAGTLSFAGAGDWPFSVRATVAASGPLLIASLELAPPENRRNLYLTEWGIAVPLALKFHPSPTVKVQMDRTTAAAILPRVGPEAPEVRRLTAEQDHTAVWGPILWTLAGVRQSSPTSFQVWEAWDKPHPPFILQWHNVHPGWMAVADSTSAVVGAMPGIAGIAPAEIYVDSQAKVLRMCFVSPYCRPVDLSGTSGALSGGPVYVMIEPSTQETLDPANWRDPRKRPALAGIAQTVAQLKPVTCSLPRQRAELARLPEDPPCSIDDEQFASHEPARMDQIPIWIDVHCPAGAEPLPITRGVPLARGILTDAARAALLDSDGRPVPLAARPVAFWPDKSIKWLLLDFQVRPKAPALLKYTLTIQNPPQQTGARPLAVESPGQVAVDTGKLKMTLVNRDGALLMSAGLDINGDGTVADDETIIREAGDILSCVFSHIQDTEQYASGTWLDPGQRDPGAARITELRIEEQSPLRAVVLVRADLRHKLLASTIEQKHRPTTGTPVSLRLHFHTGSSMVRIQHTFMFAGDVRYDFLRQLGIRLPLPVAPGQQISAGLDGTTSVVPRQEECGLLQEDPETALLWNGAQIARQGRCADGWLDVSGQQWGVTVGLPRMRHMFPQEIHVDAGGIWTHFYPPHVPPMDVRRYALKYGDGESTSVGWGTAFGALRTHEAFWYFHAGTQQQASGAAAVRAMLNPPLPRLRPRYVADTRVVGPVAEHGAPTSDAHMDAVLLHLPRMHRHNRDYWRWFGFWDYGDEIQVYNAYRQCWAKDDGRYGWYNNEPVRDYNYHLAFLMTGNRRMWESALAMSYHVFEVDVRHASPQPFMSPAPTLSRAGYNNSTTSGIDICGHRHNCQHWSDGYFGHRVGSPPGFRLAYYQTGDPVLHEYIRRIIAAGMKTRRSQYMSADGDEAVLWAMIMAHEMTCEQQYLDRITAYAKLQVDFARANNHYPAARASWDWATNTPGAPPDDPRGDLWIWSFGGHIALIEIANLYGDKALDEMICNWTRALEGLGPDRKRQTAWSNNIGACPMLAHYFHSTGDKAALEWFAQRLKGFHNRIPADAPTTDLPCNVMADTFPAYTPHDGYGWVYTTPTFWYVGIPAWQGALRAHAPKQK